MTKPDDDFKRASLHGRGKKIIHGNQPDDTTDNTSESPTGDAALQPDSVELDALFADSDDLGLAPAATPASTPNPEPVLAPPDLDFAYYELDLFPSEGDEEIDHEASIESAPDTSSFAALNVASDVGLDDMPEIDTPLEPLANSTTSDTGPQGEVMPPETSIEPPAADFNLSTVVEAAEDSAAFQAVDIPPTEAVTATTPDTADKAIETAPLTRQSEAIPVAEAATASPVDLRGSRKPDAGAPVAPVEAEIAPESRPRTISEAEATTPLASEGVITQDAATLPTTATFESIPDDPAVANEALPFEHTIGEPSQVAAPATTLAVDPAAQDAQDTLSTTPDFTDTVNEGIPLLEDLQRPTPVNLQVQHPVTERMRDLIPDQPETAADARQPGPYVDQEGLGGIVPLQPATVLQEAVQEAKNLPSPFGERRRPAVEQLFSVTQSPDPDLLATLVDDGRLYELWNMIEILQEEIAERPALKPSRADTYQKELLQASDLLLQSRENYDDARAVVFRIRADLRRDDEITADIERYNPVLMTYIISWFIALVVLGLLSNSFSDVLEDIDAGFFANAFTPALFGAAGGLFLAYTTLNRHVAILRDFDRAHIWWYFSSPFIGALMGFMTYTLWIAMVVTTTTQDTGNVEDLIGLPAVVWVLAFIGGLQQNWVIGRLRAMRNVNPTTEPESTPPRQEN